MGMKHEGMGLRLAGRWLPVLSFCFAVLVMASTAPAVIVDFTGGTANLVGGGTYVPSNSGGTWGVTSYVEGEFKVDFLGDNGFIGVYYGGANDVIHGHWLTGGIGTLTEIRVSKVGGGPFDLNYFELTSNTIVGGGPANGSERAYITANYVGALNATSILLPPDNWGWNVPNPQIFLPAAYDAITSFSFTVSSPVACYGMDMFYIDEPAPPDPTVPEPITAAMVCMGLLSLVPVVRRRLRL
jgi:hypothetical protein